MITDVIEGAGIDVDQVRVTVRSAKWVRQPRLIDPLGAPRTDAARTSASDRVHLEIMVENFGAVQRAIGRNEFRIVAQDGMGWAPLADDFPAIVLSPGEQLTTKLVFEIPASTARLALLSLSGGDAARIPIADDDLGGLFGALCRALAGSWYR